jgi:hypothetical protein
MSILIASLYCNGYIDVLYDMMTKHILYEPQDNHNPYSMMATYSNIINVPNIHHTLFELGSMYIILQCCKWYNGVCPQDVFNDYSSNSSCIVKKCKGNLKQKLQMLTYKPYSAMMQITCDELDAYFYKVAQDAIKNIRVVAT